MADMASFGYPGRVQSYTEGCYPGEAAIHRANPVLKADGTWDDAGGKAIVSLPIPTQLVDKLAQLKEQDLADESKSSGRTFMPGVGGMLVGIAVSVVLWNLFSL